MKQILITIAAVVLVGCWPSISIHKAAEEGNIEVVKQHLAAGVDVNAKNKKGMTPLHLAIYKDNSEIARIEYYDNGRIKDVSIVSNDSILYERKWNDVGIEETSDRYVTGTRLDSDFHLNGSLKYECTYLGEKKHGMEWWFDEDRNPLRIDLYLNGNQLISHELIYQ